MAYSFRAADETLEAGLRRIAVRQIETGLAELDDPDLPRARAVHQVRKRCKKLRGLLRLVRPGFKAYDRENAAFRDAARSLSALRDASAHVEAFDRLAERYGDDIDPGALTGLREHLMAGRTEVDEDLARARLGAFQQTFQAARQRAARWTLKGDASDILGKGARLTYRRAVRAMKAARADPTPEALHEWRKRVKYHWYHTRLLKALWPALMEPWGLVAGELGEALGDHHDLAVLRAEVLEREDAASNRSFELLDRLARAEQDRLEAAGFAAGARLFAERPDAFAERWARYWTLWREECAAG